jgi:hypothetical protein
LATSQIFEARHGGVGKEGKHDGHQLNNTTITLMQRKELFANNAYLKF